jgi:protein TonB
MRDPEILKHCLVEGDTERVGRFRRLRREAVLLSVLFQALVLAALLLAPLATPSTLPRRREFTPVPPYRGNSRSPVHSITAQPSSGMRPVRIYTGLRYPPIFLPHPTAPSNDANHPEIGVPSEFAFGPGNPGNANDLLPGLSPGPATPQPPQPKPVAPRPRTIKVTEGVEAALLSYRVIPRYPILALQTRTEGEVKLYAIISIDGAIRSLEVERGNPLLVQAALDAVREWRYHPAQLNGQKVEVDTFITVIFHIDR